jgi:hypothetical protein
MTFPIDPRPIRTAPMIAGSVEDDIDIMLDLELVSSDKDAAIVSIGACAFAPLSGPEPSLEDVRANGFDVAINLATALKVGMSFDPKNFYWWLQQPRNVREAIMADPQPVRDALSGFRKYLAHHSGDNPKRLRLWAMPAAGDIVILENAYAAIGSRVPWLAKNRRCLSTIKAILPVLRDEWPSRREPADGKHIAIVDVHRQILDARHACRLLAQLAALRGDVIPPTTDAA